MSILVPLIFLFAGQIASADGVIHGTVVNGSRDNVPCENATVVLRARVDGQFLIVDETQTDHRGEFQFVGLPTDEGYIFLPGANHDQIHYPGARVQFTPNESTRSVRIVAYDAVSEPSPLLLKQHDVTIECQPERLVITEKLVVDNPSLTTFVGASNSSEHEPTTLKLAIPSEFERVTFAEEFFGRQFSIADDRVVTAIPWTPGQRELAFTYTLRNETNSSHWVRPLDLPTQQVRLEIIADPTIRVVANLPLQNSTDNRKRVFASDGRQLPAGYRMEVQLGNFPISWQVLARWIAVGLLLLLLIGVGVWIRRSNAKQT